MISKFAVQDWLKRPLRDLNWYKGFSREWVDNKLSQLVPPPVLYTKPRDHQAVGLYLASIFPCLMILFDMGLGKSKLMLDTMAQKLAAGRITKCLVLVPTLVLQYSWKAEAEIHQPGLKVVILDGPLETRIAQILGDVDLIITTYQGWLGAIADQKPTGEKKKGKKKEKVKWEINDSKYLRYLFGQIQMVIWDESANALANHDSLYCKAAKLQSKYCRYRYALTGTPFGKDPTSLWSQFFVLDHGESLGHTLGLMREAFFDSKPGYFGGYDRKFRQNMRPALKRMMNNRALHYDRSECDDLPPVTYVRVPIVLPKDTETYYDKLVEDFYRSQGNVDIMANVFVRMRYLTSGFLTAKQDSGEEIVSYFEENYKRDALLNLLASLPQNEKVIIFNDYVLTGNMLQAELKKAKIKHSRVYSGTKDKQGELARFVNDPTVRTILLNSASGSLGLNLQCAAYLIFYESPVSPIIRSQAVARSHRTGQLRSCFVYDLMVKNTVDERILKSVNDGIDFFEDLVSRKQTL